DRNRQRAVYTGDRRPRLSGAIGRRGRPIHLLYRLRSAGPEAGTPGTEKEEIKKAGAISRAGFFGSLRAQFNLARTSAMPLASRSSATEPLTDCDRIVEAASTAALAAAARTSASAWASASAILPSA